MVANVRKRNQSERLRERRGAVFRRVVRGGLSGEQTMEQILRAGKGKPCRYLKRTFQQRKEVRRP